MFSVRRLFRRRPDARDIAAGEGLGDGQTHVLFPGEALVRQPVPQRGVVGPLPHGRQTDHHAGHVAVLEPSRHPAGQFLRDDQVVEVVKLLRVDGASHQLPAVQVLARSQAHGEHVVPGHLVHETLRDVRAVQLLLLRLRVNVLVHKGSHGSLKPAVRLAIIRTLVGRGQPQRFTVGYGREVSRAGVDHLRFFALDRADAQTLILLQDFVAVEVVKGRRRVLARYLLQHHTPARVRVEKVRDVVHLVVDDAPDAVLGVVLGHFGPGEFPRGSLGCLLCHFSEQMTVQVWLVVLYEKRVVSGRDGLRDRVGSYAER